MASTGFLLTSIIDSILAGQDLAENASAQRFIRLLPQAFQSLVFCQSGEISSGKGLAIFRDDLYAGEGRCSQDQQFLHRCIGAKFLGHLRFIYLGSIPGCGFVSPFLFQKTGFDGSPTGLKFRGIGASLLSQGPGEDHQPGLENSQKRED